MNDQKKHIKKLKKRKARLKRRQGFVPQAKPPLPDYGVCDSLFEKGRAGFAPDRLKEDKWFT